MGTHEIGVELWSLLDDKEVESMESFANYFVDSYYENSMDMFVGNIVGQTDFEFKKKKFCEEFGIKEEDLEQILEDSKFRENVNQNFEIACDDLYYEIEKYRKKKNYAK